MRIVSEIDYTLAGFQTIFEEIGHEWIWWVPGRPAFDVFDELKPNLAITKRPPPPGFIECLREFNIPWIGKEENKIVVRMHGSTYEYPLRPLVDPLVFTQGEPDNRFLCDISYIGPVNPTMLKLCDPIGKYNIKIGGPEHWPVVQYIGDMTPDQARRLYASSTMLYVETLEEALRAAACKKPFITLNKDVDKIFSVTFVEQTFNPSSEDYSHLQDDILGYLEVANETTVDKITETYYQKVIPEHTYMNFLIPILNDIKLQDDAQKITDFINERYK